MSTNFRNLKENAELRLMARRQLAGRWFIPILVSFLFSFLIGLAGGLHDVGGLLALIITGPLTLGQIQFYVGFKEGSTPPVETLFGGFKRFVAALLLWILILVFTSLWALLLIIPGIVAALSYSQAFYILNENPGMEALDAIRRSKEMMKGCKGKLFMMWLSFVGWGLLCILTLGIGFLWLGPYIQLSLLNFYDDMKNSSLESL